MAFTRSLSTRASFFARRHRPSLAYIIHVDDRKPQPQPPPESLQRCSEFSSSAATLFRDRTRSPFAISPSAGLAFCRYMSTTVGDGSGNLEIVSEVAQVVKDTSGPVLDAASEVALANADCWLPVILLQYVINSVHSFTGLNWWASIILTTLLIRGCTLPLLVYQLKATSKLTLMQPKLRELQEQVQASGMDPAVTLDYNKKMKQIFAEHGVTPFTPMKGLLIQGPLFISFYLAISKMAEKMPSFKSGGALWFTDLSSPDTLYIFPVLTALTFLITVECNMQEGLEGNTHAGTMKNVSRGLAVLTVPFTMNFPKAIFCYWITSNLFSLTYGLVLKVPGVKEALGVPKMPRPPPNTGSARPSFDLFSALKKLGPAAPEPVSLPVIPSKVADQKISSSSVVSQRLKSLEKQVKGRKKNKRR